MFEEEYQALLAANGNRTEASKALGLARSTYRERLDKAIAMYGEPKYPGKIYKPINTERALPKGKKLHVYLLTSAQNNTAVHQQGLDNMIAYRDALEATGKIKSEIIIGTFTYNKNAYTDRDVKRGATAQPRERQDYDDALKPFIHDYSILLAPSLVWCGEQNIIPTAMRPTSRFETYNGTKSNIIPHAKIELASVPVMADNTTKLNHTTGAITARNYLAKKDGLLAEQSHNFAFLVVEVNSKGRWFARQVHIQENGSFCDVGNRYLNKVWVHDGVVTSDADIVSSVYWFDVHAVEMEPWVHKSCWGVGGILDVLKPTHQFMGDVLSMRSRNHHDEKNFRASFSKFLHGEDLVEEEFERTAKILNSMTRPSVTTVVVPSNHDDHFERWICEADFRKDLPNASFLLRMQSLYVDTLQQDADFNAMQEALVYSGVDPNIEFPGINSSYVVSGVENIIHGHLGPNGSRGNAKNLSKLSIPLNKGHSHTVEIVDNVYSAGASRLTFPYMKGPHSHSIGFIITYHDGSRAAIVMYDGGWRG